MSTEEESLSPEEIQRQLLKYEPKTRYRVIEKLILAALSSIP